MPKLIELINDEAWEQARQVAENYLIQMMEAPTKRGPTSTRPAFRTATPLEVGLPILEAVHGALWQAATPTGRDDRWTRVWKGTFADVAARITGLTGKDLEAFAFSCLQQLYRLRVVAKRGSRYRHTLYLAPWSERAKIPSFNSSQRIYPVVDEQEEKRIEEFANTPVKTTYTLPDVPLPDNPTLADLIAWAREVKERWTAAFDRVNRAYEETRKALEEAEAELEKLRPLAADAETQAALAELTEIWSS